MGVCVVGDKTSRAEPSFAAGRRGPSEEDVALTVLTVHVECDADERAWTTPRRLRLGKRVVEVAEILDRWIGEDHAYVKVCGDDGRLYIVRHDMPSGRWELTLYDRRGPER